MSFSNSELESFAVKHGVTLDTVAPPNSEERHKALKQLLQNNDVPFPISQENAGPYLDNSHKPFGIGTLSEENIDLGEYQNYQDYNSLTFEEHLSWACLIKDQKETKERYACKEYLQGEDSFPIKGTTIPDYHFLNARLYQQTGWQLATVSTIIPSSLFFHCHRHRFFPVTTMMRSLGTDYLEEPDIGHDLAGHIATFTIPQVAQVMNNHGVAHEWISEQMRKELISAKTQEESERVTSEAEQLLLYAGRIYWFTVEFGLVMQENEMVAFGAGILSSPGETPYSIESPKATRILIDPTSDRDLLRLAATDYLIDEYQKTYFVMKDFESLSSITPERILSVIEEAKHIPHLGWRDIVEGDNVINSGAEAMTPGEKFQKLSQGRPIDEASKRVALRNLELAESQPDEAFALSPSGKLLLESILH